MIGLFQEGSAEKAAEALKAMLSSDAVVVRDGKEVKIPADMLVPGDIVKLSLGDKIPADLRLVEVSNLSALEAALTGESVPIDKKAETIKVEGDPMQTPLGDRHNMCFSATLISSGSGTGLVVATGDTTEIGTINALVNKVEKKKTNVLYQIDQIAKGLTVAILMVGFATGMVAYYVGGQSGIDAFSTALVCAVAMIPEGLEALVTVVRSALRALQSSKICLCFALTFVNVFFCLYRPTVGQLQTWPRKTPSSARYPPSKPWGASQ